MKKIISIIAAVLVLIGTFSLPAMADAIPAESAEIYVTIANKGTLALVQEKITVTDIDEDGALTVNDALYCAHDAKYDGGASAGYSYYLHAEYGLSLGKLWGDESGSFGYYVNNSSAMGLGQKVKNGDTVYAFVYSDTDTWSDTYCYFETNSIHTEAGLEITLTLLSAGYDASWNPVVLPVKDATITLDGATTEYKTDDEGKVTLTLERAGDIIISAKSDTQTLVPPVCVATVAAEPLPDLTALFIACVIVAVLIIAVVIIVILVKKNKANAK